MKKRVRKKGASYQEVRILIREGFLIITRRKQITRLSGEGKEYLIDRATRVSFNVLKGKKK